MKFYWWIGLVLYGVSTANPTVSTDNGCDCQATPLFQFKPGMQFFFPKDSFLEGQKAELSGYNITGKRTNLSDDLVTYDLVAGKTFTLQQIMPGRQKVGGVEHSYPVLVLKDSGVFTIYYVGSFEAMEVSQKEYNAGEKQTNSLPMTVCVDDFLNCQKDTTKCYRPGKRYYFKLPVADHGSKPVKFQHIQLVSIEKGTWANPVRVSYTVVGSTEIHSVDVGAAVKGLAAARQDHNLFNDFFMKPVDYLTMCTSFGGDTALWNAFLEDNILPRMKKVALDLAYGPPDDLKTKFISSGKQETGTYSKRKVCMLEGEVKTVE